MKGKTSVVKICKNFWKEIPVFEYCRGDNFIDKNTGKFVGSKIPLLPTGFLLDI